MRAYITLEASTREPRQRATSEALRVVGEQGGSVTSSHLLGGMALVLSFELPEPAARSLAVRLDAIGVRLDAPCRDALERAGDCVGSLVVRFYADERDAKIEIPKVPG